MIKNSTGIATYEPSIKLAVEYANTNNNEALKWAQEARKIAYKYGDSSKIVKSSRVTGQLLNRLARPKEAEQILLLTAPIAKRNNLRDEVKNILSNIALAYTVQAKYDKALDANFQALLLREEDKDAEISISLNNIGLVYFKLKNYEKALDYYERALKSKDEVGDKNDLDRLHINIGLCYNQLKDFTSAHKYFENGFALCNTQCSEQIKVEGNFGLGVSHYGMEDFARAQDYFNQSYALAKKINNKRFESENLIYLAHVFVRLGDRASAVRILAECEKIAVELGYNEILIETYKEFSNLYNQDKDFKEASIYQNKYIDLKDSIYSEDLIKNIAKVQTDFEERENRAIIATKEEVIQRQHSLNVAIGIIALLACLLIFVLYQSIKVKKKVNVALTEAKNFIELKNKELDKKVAEKTVDLEVANQALSKVNEELDNFIYKTSHDIRGPLASLKGICNVALMDVSDPIALNYLAKLDLTAEHLNTILTRLLIINQINNSSMKPELINFEILVDEVLTLERKKGIPSRITIHKEIQKNSTFYCDREFIRIILENLIDNSIKFHNNSIRVEPFVSICVEQDNQDIKIRVVDNGIGIMEAKPDKIFQMFSRASERSSTGGIGLYITKTATEKLGGTVGLKTTPEGYTEFFVKFPLKQQWFDAPEWAS